MMKIYKLIMFIIVLAGAMLQKSCTKYENPRYVKLAHALTQQTAKKLEAEKGLVLCGTGGGMMDDIKFMMMAFTFSHSVSEKEARDLLVYSVEKYLSAINNDKEIRPFLHSYPFTANEVEIEIYFPNKDNSTLEDVPLRIICVNEEKVSFYTRDPQSDTLKKIHSESYETSLQIYKEEHATK